MTLGNWNGCAVCSGEGWYSRKECQRSECHIPRPAPNVAHRIAPFASIIIIAGIIIIIAQFSNEIDDIFFSSDASFRSTVRICAN